MRFRPNYLSALLVVAALAPAVTSTSAKTACPLDVASGKATDEWSRTYTVTKGGIRRDRQRQRADRRRGGDRSSGGNQGHPCRQGQVR